MVIMSLDLLSQPITEAEEQQFCVEMMKRLDIQRRNEQFCDVILEVGSGDDQARLKAHRIVLCAASPFFYNALNSDMKEKKEGVIRLEETSKAVMEEVLEYLYTGHVDINEHNEFDLLAVADYFLIPSLKSLCSKVILQTLSLYNCIAAYYFAVKYRCEELQKKARAFILAYFVAVAETEDFLNLSIAQMQEWISSNEIIVQGEEEVFEAIMKWIDRNESQKQSFYDLFCHIRCIYVPRAYLINVMLSNPFVKDNLECSNSAVDAMKMVFSGSDDCYFAQSPRDCLKSHEDTIVACGHGIDTFCYVPSKNAWCELADMCVQSRADSCQICSYDGKLFSFRGSWGVGYCAECYDPSVNTWSPLTQVSIQETTMFCTVVTFQGFVYVIGGLDQEDGIPLSTVQRYNPDTNLWQVMPSLGTPRSSVCAVANENHLYTIGGKSESEPVDVVERFDPKEQAWSRISSTLEKREGAGGAAVNQKVYVFGGLSNEAPASKACEMYDPATNLWSAITSTVALQGFASAVSFKEKIYVFGKFRENDTERVRLQCFDIDKNKWSPCSDDVKFFPGEHFTISRLRILKDFLVYDKQP
ncbi:kelch-like protein 11 [Oculina patagonica]